MRRQAVSNAPAPLRAGVCGQRDHRLPAHRGQSDLLGGHLGGGQRHAALTPGLERRRGVSVVTQLRLQGVQRFVQPGAQRGVGDHHVAGDRRRAQHQQGADLGGIGDLVLAIVRQRGEGRNLCQPGRGLQAACVDFVAHRREGAHRHALACAFQRHADTPGAVEGLLIELGAAHDERWLAGQGAPGIIQVADGRGVVTVSQACLRRDGQRVGGGPVALAVAQRDFRLPVHAHAQKAGLAAARVHRVAVRDVAVAIGDALCIQRHAVGPQHQAGAAGFALGVFGVEIQGGVGDRHAARHRHVELLARIAVAQDHGLADAQIRQRGVAGDPVVALQLPQRVTGRAGHRAQRQQQAGGHQCAAERLGGGEGSGFWHGCSRQRIQVEWHQAGVPAAVP